MELLVANFDDAVTVDDLRMLFLTIGNVQGVEIFEVETRRHAVVQMHSRCAERAIIELDGEYWRGRRLVVIESPRPITSK